MILNNSGLGKEPLTKLTKLMSEQLNMDIKNIFTVVPIPPDNVRNIVFTTLSAGDCEFLLRQLLMYIEGQKNGR